MSRKGLEIKEKEKKKVFLDKFEKGSRAECDREKRKINYFLRQKCGRGDEFNVAEKIFKQLLKSVDSKSIM